MASLITIKLNKNAGSSWGFRLQGGKDFATPLCIQKVNVGSVASQAGLQAGDAIVSIGNRDALSLRHKEAQDAIVTAGNNFDMVVQRGSQIWKPTVAPLPEKIISDGVTVVTKTSLASSQKIVNTQYNSPVNIYSEDSIAETLSAQAEVLGKGGVLGINFQKFAREEKIRTDSPTYKLLHGEEEPQRKQRPASQNFPDSSSPFQRDVTQEQKGYYNINERLYCDVHAKQAARSNPPAPNFEPVTVQPGVAPPVGAVTAPQASRMKVPAAFQHGGPAPVPAPAPQPEVPQPVVQEVPAPQPEPVFEPTPVPMAVPEVPSQPSSQFVEEEGVQSPPLLNGGTTEEEALLPPQDTSDHVTEERHISESESKLVENGYVEETEKEVSAQEAEPLTDSQPSNLIQNGENLISEPISDTKPVETSACETISETKEIDLPEKIEAVPMPAAEVSEPAPEVVPEPETVLQQMPTESVPPSLIEPTAPAPTVSDLPLFKPPEPFSVNNAVEKQPVVQNTGSLLGTDGTFSNVSHFHSEESRFTETKLSSSSSVFQSSVGIEAVTQRAPAPAPAPIKPFAPAPAPAPAPVAAAPMKPAPAPAYSTSANPQGFGAPAGDINVRSHIPKKDDVQNIPSWPPHNFIPDQVSSEVPYQLVKKKQIGKPEEEKPAQQSFVMPLPTSKDLPANISTAAYSVPSKPKGPSFLTSRPSKMKMKSPPRKGKNQKGASRPFRLYSDRFPNPAPSYLLKFTHATEDSSDTSHNVFSSEESQYTMLKKIEEGLLQSRSSHLKHQTNTVTQTGVITSSSAAGVTSGTHPRVKTKISPIRSKPINEPMPSVSSNTKIDPKATFETALKKYASNLLTAFTPPKLIKSAPAPKSGSRFAFKQVKSPNAAKSSQSGATPKIRIEMPVFTPVESVKPIVVDIDSLTIANE